MNNNNKKYLFFFKESNREQEIAVSSFGLSKVKDNVYAGVMNEAILELLRDNENITHIEEMLFE